jgi:uncharacterized membrane protein
VSSHKHSDTGGGYCVCGAERCCLPTCDGWCKHPDGWVDAYELAELRRIDVQKMYLEMGSLPPWESWA